MEQLYSDRSVRIDIAIATGSKSIISKQEQGGLLGQGGEIGVWGERGEKSSHTSHTPHTRLPTRRL
jgi:hypothetical protein